MSVFGIVGLSLLRGVCRQAASLSAQDKDAIEKIHDDIARMITAEKADPVGLVAMFHADDATALPPK